MADNPTTDPQFQVPKAMAALGVAFAQSLLECVDSPRLLEILRSKTEDMVRTLADRGEIEAAMMLSYFQRALYDQRDFPKELS